ncbi:MAG: response regulator [Flavobacterium sp.]|nr:MAG: response regulator [Flavobacterium sp.]
MTKTLFYVDNDSDELTTFLYAAKTLDIEVRLFKNGEQILDELRNATDKPFAVFVDLNMPGIDGFEVIRTVAADKQLSAVAVIAFSTAADQRTVSAARQVGATCYISKPNTIAKLKKVLQFAIGNDWESFDKDSDFLVKY